MTLALILPLVRNNFKVLKCPYRSLNIFSRTIKTSSTCYDDSSSSNQSSEDLGSFLNFYLMFIGPPIRRPRKYLDMKTFRKFLKQQKTLDIENEKRIISKAHSKPPPG